MSYQNYNEVVSANNKSWKSEARQLMEKGVEFVVIHLKQEDFRDAKALQQEFDYEGLHEEPSVIEEYPDILPSKIGFVKRKKKNNNQDSK